jgi:ABC-type transporter Mla MlaB component
VDTSSSDPWDPESAALLPASVGVYQGTISHLRHDQVGSCGNSEDLVPCAPDVTLGTPVRRTQAARAGCGDTGFDDGGLRIARTGSPSGLVITGDIDEFTYLRLTAALAGLADGDGDIHLDLAAVQYCDLAGLRALIRLSAARDDQPDHEGRRVILHGLPAYLETVLQILGWDSMPGLVLAGVQDPAPS